MQKNKLAVIAVVAACAVAVCAVAQSVGFRAVDAQYVITGALIVNPPPNQQKDRVAIFLTGAGAQELYEAIPSKVESADICEEGMKVKRSGGLECTNIGGRNYSCSVGILLKTGETKPVSTC